MFLFYACKLFSQPQFIYVAFKASQTTILYRKTQKSIHFIIDLFNQYYNKRFIKFIWR